MTKKYLASIFSPSKYVQLLQAELAKYMEVESLPIQYREFPDKESCIRLEHEVTGKDIIIVDSLDNPNHKILPLLLLSETLRNYGAKKVGLIAPYLSYMRQDKSFNDFEGITSKYFAKLISNYFNWLITVDPHLHRYKDLKEIYSIPTKIVHAEGAIANFIKDKIKNPVIIGPDMESEQWIAAISKPANAPYVVFNKIRKSDVDVAIAKDAKSDSMNLEKYKNHTPVVVDDIISTAHTMIEAIKQLKTAMIKAEPICIGIHAVFANDFYQELQELAAKNIYTCNTIIHDSNGINILGDIAKVVPTMF